MLFPLFNNHISIPINKFNFLISLFDLIDIAIRQRLHYPNSEC